MLKYWRTSRLYLEITSKPLAEIADIIKSVPLTSQQIDIARMYYMELRDKRVVADSLGISKATLNSELKKIHVRFYNFFPDILIADRNSGHFKG